MSVRRARQRSQFQPARTNQSATRQRQELSDALSSQAARETNHLHLPDTEHDTIATMSIRVPTTSLSFVLPVDPFDTARGRTSRPGQPTGREAWRYSTAVTDSLCPEYDASVDTLTRDRWKHPHLSRV
jgi:hypothetical protein